MPEIGYLAFPEPAKTPLPTVLVLLDAWGVDAHIERDSPLLRRRPPLVRPERIA
jgi:hypothetical protein